MWVKNFPRSEYFYPHIARCQSTAKTIGQREERRNVKRGYVLLARVRRIGTTHRRLRDGTSDCDSSSPTTIAPRARERRDGGRYVDPRAVPLRKIARRSVTLFSKKQKHFNRVEINVSMKNGVRFRQLAFTFSEFIFSEFLLFTRDISFVARIRIHSSAISCDWNSVFIIFAIHRITRLHSGIIGSNADNFLFVVDRLKRL